LNASISGPIARLGGERLPWRRDEELTLLLRDDTR
jgi:hypothetical protein